MRKRGQMNERGNAGCVLGVLIACGVAACGSHTVLPLGSNADGGGSDAGGGSDTAHDAGFVLSDGGWTTFPITGADAGSVDVPDGSSSTSDDAATVDASLDGATSDAGITAQWQLALSAGAPRLVGRDVPVPVSQCIPGGNNGRVTGYSEGMSESRARAVRIVWDHAATFSVGLSSSPTSDPSVDAAFVRWLMDRAFQGVTSASTSQSLDKNFTAAVRANQYGVWYRQANKLERVALIYYRDAQWPAIVVGTAYFVDWSWSQDLAQGPRCGEELPPSRLPPAFDQP